MLKTNPAKAALVAALVFLCQGLIWGEGASPCVVAFEVERPVPTCSNNTDVWVQKVLPDGTCAWEAPLGVSVASSDDYERAPVVVADGKGGAIVVFELKHSSGPRNTDVDLYAQRVNAQGERLWGQGAAVAVAATQFREHHAQVVSDGAGGALVFFYVDFPVGNGACLTGVCGQRITADGKLQWLEGQRSVVVEEAEAHCQQLSVVADGAGGAYVSCLREPLEARAAVEPSVVLLRRYEGLGNQAWGPGTEGVRVVGASLRASRNAHLVATNEGVWAVYEHGAGRRPGVAADLFARDGSITLKACGVLPAEGGGMSPALQGPSPVVSDGAQGFICGFVGRGPGGTRKLWAARIGGDGVPQWGHPTPVNLLPLPEMGFGRYLLAAGMKREAIVALTSPVNAPPWYGDFALSAQRLSNTGSPLWGSVPTDVIIPQGASVSLPQVVVNADGSSYVFYVVDFDGGRWKGDSSVFGLRLDPMGRRLWPQPVPVAATPRREGGPSACSLDH